MAVKKINIKQVIPHLKKPWTPVTLGKVDDYEVRILEFEGEYFWHKHEKHDECMLVYEGAITIEHRSDRVSEHRSDRDSELDNGKEINAKEGLSACVHAQAGELVVIEKGTAHCSRADAKAVVIVFEKDTIGEDFVKL